MEVEREMEAELTSLPYVPAPVGDCGPMKVKVNMKIVEEIGEMDDGTCWTFGEPVPGNFIGTRVGDEVEFTLSNHLPSKMPHNIDLHAVTGPGGRASFSLVAGT